jgi:hypothetical protein
MSENFRAIDIKGFSPAVEPTQSQELFVLNGRNYVFDSKGPKSPFGSRFLTTTIVTGPEHVQGIRVRERPVDRCFTFTRTKIREWNEAGQTWVDVYTTPDTSGAPYRWTWGYLAGSIYFCHPATGILKYDLDSGIIAPHVAPGVPSNPIAIAVGVGLLGVIDNDWFTWSAPSDGDMFTPQLGGAGQQRISDRVSGTPIILTSFTGGFMVWTTAGVMLSRWTGTSEVFRHTTLETEFRPVNSFCTTKLDKDSTVILDQRGLFVTQGDAPKPFAPLFNEFIGPYIQKFKLNQGQNLRLEWDDVKRMLYVSVSLTYASPLYERAFALYANIDKWGSFDKAHYGILPIRIAGSEREGDYFGFVGADSRANYWLETGSCQVWVGGTAQLAPLDAEIQIGLFRPNGQQNADELSEIVNILVRSNQSGEADTLELDFNLIPNNTEDEDYNVISGADDYGFETLNYVNHGLEIISTVDGKTPFMMILPELVRFNKAMRYYSCSSVGLWHILKLDATAVGESFHLQTFEITAIPAGRLT